MSFPRATGILLHPTSLPARGGVGDFGPVAYEFVDFLAASRQGLWQVLPLGPLGYGNSPYSSTSAFAGNPLLISLDRLAERGWIDHSLIADLPESVQPLDYGAVFRRKMPLLAEAASRFAKNMSGNARARYDRFCHDNREWLDDFVLFDALRAHHKLANWNEWPREWAHREPSAIERIRQELAGELTMRRVLQFAFAEQWQALRHYCAQKSVRIVGDLAIFVNYDSADVWTHPELFHLDQDLSPIVVSGVPPDFFSATGQRWGNPLYRWDVMKSRGYAWWVERLRAATRHCDYIRLDHFRGFDQFWEINASEPTAINGRWVDGPKDDLFIKVREALGGLPFFAEDLGYITPEVHALRERLQIPGMAVLQFGFGDAGAHMYLPQQFTPNTVVYTGTHDNDTTVGWWTSGASDHEKRLVKAYLGEAEDGVHWSFIRAAQGSVAGLSVIPLQDVIGLGSEGRMNLPSEPGGNWRWRLKPGLLTADLAAKLALLAELSDRLPTQLTVPPAEEFVA